MGGGGGRRAKGHKHKVGHVRIKCQDYTIDVGFARARLKSRIGSCQNYFYQSNTRARIGTMRWTPTGGGRGSVKRKSKITREKTQTGKWQLYNKCKGKMKLSGTVTGTNTNDKRKLKHKHQ